MKTAVLIALTTTALAINSQRASDTTTKPNRVSLSTVALRVHRMDQMVAFYTQAFGARFREVNTNGFKSQFGDVAGITLKLVPIRAAVDFDGYPVHQMGFTVSDVDAVIALALKHGGRREGEVVREGGRVMAAVRDPDGNTIELYSQP